MGWIFVITDITERRIHLSQKQWVHIVHEHPTLSGRLRDVEEVLTNPLTIRQSSNNDMVWHYYRWHKSAFSYIMVVVRYLNGEGFVITSMPVRTLS